MEKKEIQERNAPEKYEIFINGEKHFFYTRYITGARIKEAGYAPPSHGLWFKTSGPEPDKEIAHDDRVDLQDEKYVRNGFFTGSLYSTQGQTTLPNPPKP